VTQGKVIFATSDSSLFHMVDAETGKPLAKVQGKAYMFGSPAVAGGVVYQGVLNGILEARDLASGELLWDFQTEASRENRAWVLTADRRFNPLIFSRSGAGDAGIVGTDRQFGIGAIFSSPLVAGGTVYLGSADGNLYALE
jgi:eukaryotic-like serine/threonine-protein kinase